MNLVDKIKLCDFCSKLRKRLYIIYQVGFITDENNHYYIGIINLEKKMSKYLFSRGCHLSTTQIVLLRPDILRDYLNNDYNIKNETVIHTFLQEAIICEKCYEKYKLEVPEK